MIVMVQMDYCLLLRLGVTRFRDRECVARRLASRIPVSGLPLSWSECRLCDAWEAIRLAPALKRAKEVFLLYVVWKNSSKAASAFAEYMSDGPPPM